MPAQIDDYNAFGLGCSDSCSRATTAPHPKFDGEAAADRATTAPPPKFAQVTTIADIICEWEVVDEELDAGDEPGELTEHIALKAVRFNEDEIDRSNTHKARLSVTEKRKARKAARHLKRFDENLTVVDPIDIERGRRAY